MLYTELTKRKDQGISQDTKAAEDIDVWYDVSWYFLQQEVSFIILHCFEGIYLRFVYTYGT